MMEWTIFAFATLPLWLTGAVILAIVFSARRGWL